ncbi:MAG: class I SAM-dependent methyltransferase [Candidatus Paceibacterota bacterium]
MSWFKTKAFWNNSENVNYFSQKPADPKIVKRLEILMSIPASTGNKSLSALDLGCGGGRHAEMLVKMGFKTSVIDLNQEMLRTTVRRVGKINLCSIRRGSIVKLPYKNETFDVIVTTGVLHQTKNIYEYQVAVKEISRVLKPGGLVCLNVFTSRILDDTCTLLADAFAYQTKEGLDMTLLSKTTFYELMAWYGLTLEDELGEDVVQENTGRRSVLRCNFIKI